MMDPGNVQEDEAQPVPGTIPQLNDGRGGYKDLSWLMNSSPGHNWNLFRRFGQLNTRCLLYLQDEIGEMEAALDQMDDSDYGSDSRRRDQHPRRPELLKLIHQRISSYSTSAASMCELQLIM